MMDQRRCTHRVLLGLALASTAFLLSPSALSMTTHQAKVSHANTMKRMSRKRLNDHGHLVPIGDVLRNSGDQVIEIDNVRVVGDKQLIPNDLQQNMLIRPLAHKEMTLAALLFRLNYTQEWYETLGINNVIVTASETDAGNGEKDLVVKVVQEGGPINIRKTHQKGYRTRVLDEIHNRIQSDKQMTQGALISSMLLANSVPGIISTYTLTPVSPHTYDLTSYNTFSRGSGYVGLSNVGQAPSGRDLYSMGGVLNGILGGDQLSVDGSISNKPKRSAFIQAQYKKTIGPWGTELRLYYSYNHGGTNPLTFYQYTSNGRKYRLSIYQPVMLDLKNRAGFTVGYEVFNGSNDGAADGQFADLVTTETIPFVYALFNYQRFENIGRFWGDAELAHGVSGLFGTKGDYTVRGLAPQFQSAYPPKKIFTRFTFTVNQLFNIPKNLGLLLSVRGQGAFNSPQFISQKFSYASGAYIGQGYSGDNGIIGRVEGQYNVPLPPRHIQQFQLYSFYEGGYVNNPRQSLIDYLYKAPSSVGGGFRLSILNYLSGFAEITKPLSEDLSEAGNRDLRFFYGITFSV